MGSLDSLANTKSIKLLLPLHSHLLSDFFLESKCRLAVLAVGKVREETGKPPGEGVWLLEPPKNEYKTKSKMLN